MTQETDCDPRAITIDRLRSGVGKYGPHSTFTCPPEIVWRDKEQFDEGSGTADLLARGLDEVMSERDARRYMAQHEETYLRSREECVYHKLLSEAYEDPSIVLDNVARWADRPGDLIV